MKRKVTDKLSTFATRLAADIEAMVLEHVDTMLDHARENAVEALRSLISGGGSSVVDEEVVDAAPIVHRDVKPANASSGKRRCTKCRKPGHRAPQCEEADAEEAKAPRSARVADVAKARRADIIAKRAGVLPTATASFDLGAEE